MPNLENRTGLGDLGKMLVGVAGAVIAAALIGLGTGVILHQSKITALEAQAAAESKRLDVVILATLRVDEKVERLIELVKANQILTEKTLAKLETLVNNKILRAAK